MELYKLKNKKLNTFEFELDKLLRLFKKYEKFYTEYQDDLDCKNLIIENLRKDINELSRNDADCKSQGHCICISQS